MVNIDIELLIDEVQKQLLSWDNFNEDYKDKNKQNSTQTEIVLS